MVIFDNIIFNLQRTGGISSYWFELCKRLSSQNTIFFESGNKNILSSALTIPRVYETFIPTFISRYLPFTRILPKHSILHSSYYRFSLQKSVINITTVYDFTYEFFFSGFQKQVHTLQKKLAVLNSDGIVCISENTKKDLLRFYPEIDSKKVKVIYISASDEYFPIGTPSIIDGFAELLNKPFVLFVGDRSHYKNFNKAVEVVKKIPILNLVVAGGKPLTKSEMGFLKTLQGRFYFYQGISAKNLNWLYNTAFCLLYPSSYEGFGIPILEAMKAGCPVVTTNLSSIPEVAGDAALLVNKPDVNSLVKKVNLLFDSATREDLIQKGFKQAAKFSWDRCFDETIAFYDEVRSRVRNGK